MAYASGYMVNVTSINKICSRRTLVHELGHNLGSQHDRDNASGGSFQPFSYGYRFTGKSGQEWRTVMAYAPGEEIPLFSSPLLNYDGHAAGVENSEDNVTSLELAAPTVAAIYSSLNGPDLTSPAPTEPSQITAKFKRISHGAKVLITGKLRKGASPRYYEPIELTWSTGRKGVQYIRAWSRTNKRGEFSYVEEINVAKNIYYRFCYPGFSRTRLCTTPIELAKVR